MTSAYVHIDLGEVDVVDLIEELESRKGFEESTFSRLAAGDLIKRLKTLGCPQSIIEQLEEWDRLPVVGPRELREWKVFCEVS